MLIKIIFCILLSVGLWLSALDIFKIPYIKTSKAVKNLLLKRRVKENAAELWLLGLSKWLARHIRINEYKRISLLASFVNGVRKMKQRTKANKFF